MSTYFQSAAAEFRKAYGLSQGLTKGTLALQRALIVEEYNELIEALAALEQDVSNKRAREHALKELSDLLYVIFQLAAAFDWDLSVAHNRVHDSNMSKLGEDGKPIRREDGKVLKGPNYKPAQLIDLV